MNLTSILTAAKHKYAEAKTAEDEKISRDAKAFAEKCFGEYAEQLEETKRPGVFKIPDSSYTLEYDVPWGVNPSPRFKLIANTNKTQSSFIDVVSLETLREAIAML